MDFEKFTPINPFSRVLSNPYKSRDVKKSESAQFSDLMMSMFATDAFGDDSDTASSTSLGNMMMPLMLSLLEKLQSMQVETSGPADSTALMNPVAGASLTQNYSAEHRGLDFGVVEGTPVKATMSGKVVFSGWNDQGYGNLVIVENGSRRTYYAHLSELPVDQGEWVNQGDVIGLSGNTGNSTGPHLHYEVRINGQAIDPTNEVFGNANTGL